MKRVKIMTACFVAAAIVLTQGVSARADVIVDVDDSTAPWIGFMNVFELNNNGNASTAQGGFSFGSGWGVPDLVANFDDGAGILTLLPNSVGDPNEFWYQNTSGTAPDPANPGGPGQLGNKFMEANLFQEFGNGTPELAALQTDGTLVFQGNVLSNSFTAAHDSLIFIKEFSPDFSTNVQTDIPLTPGAFSVSHALTGLGGAVQYGFQVKGENVWITDIAPFGSAVIAQIPEPGSIALLGVGALGLATRRRR